MIGFTCECGKQLQAREENAGKPVLCPACKRQIIVPPPEVTAIQPEVVLDPAPAESRVRRQPPAVRDEADFEDEEGPRRRPPAGSSGKAVASLVLGILSLCGCTCLAGLPSVVLGILSLRDIGRAAGSLTGKPMAIIGIVLGSLGTLCWPIVGIPGYLITQASKEQIQTQNNLKQIGIAMFNFNDVHNRLPPPGFADLNQPPNRQQGKPNLSWRVALLPFIEELTLYQQFKHDEPWDGPNNIKLLARMPKVYKVPGDTTTPSDHTLFQVFVGNGAAFDKTQPARIPATFQDGTSNTILVAVAAKGVPWTKPDDIPFNPNQPVKPLLSDQFRSGYLVLLGDGSVRILSRSISENTLKAAVTASGGEVLGPDW